MSLPLRASLVILLALTAAPLAAQTGQTAPTRTEPATAPRLVPTPASLAVAESLLRVMDLEKVMRSSVIATFDASIQQQPAMAQFRDVVLAWATKHLSWAEFGTPMARIYAEMFTETELRAFLTFYRTPAGRRLAEVTPELTRRGAEVGAAVASAHTAELQQMIQARMAELQAGATPPPPPR